MIFFSFIKKKCRLKWMYGIDRNFLGNWSKRREHLLLVNETWKCGYDAIFFIFKHFKIRFLSLILRYCNLYRIVEWHTHTLFVCDEELVHEVEMSWFVVISSEVFLHAKTDQLIMSTNHALVTEKNITRNNRLASHQPFICHDYLNIINDRSYAVNGTNPTENH